MAFTVMSGWIRPYCSRHMQSCITNILGHRSRVLCHIRNKKLGERDANNGPCKLAHGTLSWILLNLCINIQIDRFYEFPLVKFEGRVCLFQNYYWSQYLCHVPVGMRPLAISNIPSHSSSIKILLIKCPCQLSICKRNMDAKCICAIIPATYRSCQ